jgi:kynurenine 3-monooxygenase
LGTALLIGDAAHSTGGALGQGANSALLDVVELSKCIDHYCANEKHQGTIEQLVYNISVLYSERQVKEGFALWQLLQLPPKQNVFGVLYQITQLMLSLLGNIEGKLQLIIKSFVKQYSIYI